MNTTKQAISKRNVVGIYPRKGVKQYRSRGGAWYPTSSTELVDVQFQFSEFQLFKSPVGFEWITLPGDDTLIAYGGGQVSRTPLPAGTRVRRVLSDYADWAGIVAVAVILPPDAS